MPGTAGSDELRYVPALHGGPVVVTVVVVTVVAVTVEVVGFVKVPVYDTLSTVTAKVPALTSV